MASKTVQPIAIELGIKGGEKLAALNGSFRDLSKQTKLSDEDIVQATQDIIKFAKEVGISTGKLVPSLDGTGIVQLGLQTRKFKKDESSQFIEWLFAWGAENGVTFNEKS